MNRCPGGGPSAPTFSTVPCLAFVPFVLLYGTAAHLCVEGSEMSAQTPWLMLILVTAGRLLHQRGRTEFIKALLEEF